MKSILYVGATLMIGASIYGFVDYKHTQNKKEFKEMYTEPAQPAEEEVVTDEKTTGNKTIAVVPVAEKKESNAVKNETVVKKNTVAVKKTIKKTKKKRTFNTRLFGRGALDERYTEPLKPVSK
jgi:hypothetical protein